LLASIQLTNTFNTIVEDGQVGNAIYSNQVQLAVLILTNGQQISSIDQQEGQVQAQAFQAIAQVQATTAQKQANNSFISGLVSAAGSALAAYFTGGASIIAQGVSSAAADAAGNYVIGAAASASVGPLASSFSTLANGYDSASADLEIGNIQANEATQIADLNAQIEQINANEQAQQVYVQADTTMLNLSANLASLQQQAQAQEVQVQLAAQQVDQERSKLANLMSQAGSLLQQWSRSASLVTQNPAFSSDLLLIRDDKIQQADDAFALAQEWSFLTALAFDYKYNCPTANSFHFVQATLAARNCASLNTILGQMQSEATILSSTCQSSPLYSTIQFSVRNNFFQANQTILSNGIITVTSYQPVLDLYAGTILTNAAASLAAWSNYLASNLFTNQYGERILSLTFSTTLDNNQQLPGSPQRNPLWTCDTFGTTLYSGSDNNGNTLHGVQMSLVTQGFSFPLGSSAGFPVQLAQTGASAIRSRGFGNPTSGSPGFRYFNFGGFTAGLTAAANNLNGSTGTAAFQNRSPANGLWLLTINEGDSENNQALLNNLGQLTDIQLQFGILGYIDQNATANCNQR